MIKDLNKQKLLQGFYDDELFLSSHIINKVKWLLDLWSHGTKEKLKDPTGVGTPSSTPKNI